MFNEERLSDTRTEPPRRFITSLLMPVAALLLVSACGAASSGVVDKPSVGGASAPSSKVTLVTLHNDKSWTVRAFICGDVECITSYNSAEVRAGQTVRLETDLSSSSQVGAGGYVILQRQPHSEWCYGVPPHAQVEATPISVGEIMRSSGCPRRLKYTLPLPGAQRIGPSPTPITDS